MMMDCVRYISTLFGARYVVLIDYTGERRIRLVKWRAGRAFASWLSFGIRDCWLLDGGALGNGAYVIRWEPYYPFGVKNWPVPA